MEVKMVDPLTLIPHPKNPRAKHAIEKIQKSIAAFGFTNPVLVQKGTNRIIAGHGRVEAAKRQEIKEVPVIELDLDDVKSKAYMIADNKLTEESSWNYGLLEDVLKELETDFDLNLTGFDNGELSDIIKGWREEKNPVPATPNNSAF